MNIFCGIDIGERSHVVCIIDESGAPRVKSRSIDESRNGHNTLIDILAPFVSEHTVYVGFEATGVYYKNVMNSLYHAHPSLKFIRVNPLAARRFRESWLPRNTNDRTAARSLADMISERWKNLTPYLPGNPDELACVTDEMVDLIRQQTRLINKLRAHLVVANPEVQEVFPDVTTSACLAVLSRYPTAAHLARARVDKVASLRSGAPRSHRVGEERAQTLIESAKTSIASDTTPQRARCIVHLVAQMKTIENQLKECRRDLSTHLGDIDNLCTPGEVLQEPSNDAEARRQDIALIASIPGVSNWGAAFIVSHTPDIRGFATFEKLNAFVGTCPRYEHSGIKDTSPGVMSKRGSKKLRWLLFMEALAATRRNPVVCAYYHRHLSLGKPKMKAVAACMTKVLRLMYGVIHSRMMFDPAYNFKKHVTQIDTMNGPTHTRTALSQP